MLFDSSLDLPAEIAFTMIDTDPGSGSGTLVADDGRVILVTDHRLSYATGSSTRRILHGTLGDKPMFLSGHIWSRQGSLGLLVSEIRIGSAEPEPKYVKVAAAFEHGGLAAAHRPEDGAGRSVDLPLDLPPIGEARGMSLRFPVGDSVVLESVSAAPLEEFVLHLAAWQDLLSFCEDAPIARLSLEAVEEDGAVVRIHGLDRYPPFAKQARTPVEFVLRLGASYAQGTVAGWWRARDDLRPVTQVLTGTTYQPGFVESDLIALAAITERTGRAVIPGPSSRTYREILQELAAGLGPELLALAKIDQAEWVTHLVWARNDIAHEGAPNNTRGERFVTDAESRALRDATRIILVLTIAKHVAVPDAALARAAERLGVRYAGRHSGTSIFRQ